MLRPGKTEELAEEMNYYSIEILAIQGTRRVSES